MRGCPGLLKFSYRRPRWHKGVGQLTDLAIGLASGALQFAAAVAEPAEEAFGDLAADAMTDTENQNVMRHGPVTFMLPEEREKRRMPVPERSKELPKWGAAIPIT